MIVESSTYADRYGPSPLPPTWRPLLYFILLYLKDCVTRKKILLRQSKDTMLTKEWPLLALKLPKATDKDQTTSVKKYRYRFTYLLT
jgi:hypothetical protein